MNQDVWNEMSYNKYNKCNTLLHKIQEEEQDFGKEDYDMWKKDWRLENEQKARH